MKHGAEGTKTKRVSNVLDFAHCIRGRVDEGGKAEISDGGGNNSAD